MTALHLAESSGWMEGIEELLRTNANTELRIFRTGALHRRECPELQGDGRGAGFLHLAIDRSSLLPYRCVERPTRSAAGSR
jgi:hypothetical protein